uniref:Uncharacterized protein n=1 Tax=Vitis vinifera TaxID=29760 RepID=F6HJ01_VITVI
MAAMWPAISYLAAWRPLYKGGSRVWLIPSVALRKLRGATVASFVSGDAH